MRLILSVIVSLILSACNGGFPVSNPSARPAVSPSVSFSPSPNQSPSPVGSTRCQYGYENGLTLPDPVCTPGVTNPDVTQANLFSNICKSGWTATVRPPVSYTNALKLQGMQDYGSTGAPSNFEEDHLISLELGGSPRDPKNLWPEPGASPNIKDSVEDKAHSAVCAGTLKLTDAQYLIATDWPALGRQLGITGL